MVNEEWSSFIHMSDIHFRLYSGDPYDLDNPLRKAMINDLRSCVSIHLKNMKGILVCGDLAYSGKDEEFILYI